MDFQKNIQLKINQNMDLFKKLIKIESENLSKNEYLLSVYLPTDRLNIGEIKKRVKSIFLKKEILKNDVFAKVESQVNVIKNYKNGLAIFAKIKNQNGTAKMSDEDLWIETILSTPEQSLNCGKIFNLDQLIWDNQSSMCSIILNLNQDEAKIYGYKNNQIHLIKRIENPLAEDRGKETSVNGETRINQDKIETARGLLNEVTRVIKLDEREVKNGYDYFTIVYSSNFTDLIDSFSATIQQIHSHSKEMLLINKNIKTDDELKEVVAKEINSKNRIDKRQSLNKAKSMYTNYIEGWERVVEAANVYKIKKLFIKNRTKIKGYVLNSSDIYMNPIREAKLASNVVPWLFKSVLSSDGEIIIFNKNERINFSEIAAQIRY